MEISLQRHRSTDRYKKSLGRRLVSSRALIPSLFIAAIILFACLHVWQRVYVFGLVKEVSRLEKESANLDDLLKKTNAEIADLSRLSRVEEVASRELGLGRTKAENMFTLVLKKPEVKRDALDNVVLSLRKLADNLPVLTESKADTINVFDTNGN